MKKVIVIITLVVSALVLVCAFIVNPFIKQYKEQTIISDCEYSTGIDLPDNIKPLKGSRSLCYPKSCPISAVCLIAELQKSEYEFIINQVANKDEWGFTQSRYEIIEERLKEHGWQNEKYEFFCKIESSKVTRWHNEQKIAIYMKDIDTYILMIFGGTDFTEYRNIEI